MIRLLTLSRQIVTPTSASIYDTYNCCSDVKPPKTLSGTVVNLLNLRLLHAEEVTGLRRTTCDICYLEDGGNVGRVHDLKRMTSERRQVLSLAG